MEKHLRLLGFKVKDVVTGFEGVVTSIDFALFGCVQAVVTPPVDKDNKQQDGKWFDTSRLRAISDEPVMPVSAFPASPEVGHEIVHGGEAPPQFASKPIR